MRQAKMKTSGQAVCISTVTPACEAFEREASKLSAEKAFLKQPNQKLMTKAVLFLRKKGGKKLDKLYSSISFGLLGTAVKVDQCFLLRMVKEFRKLCTELDTLARSWYSRPEQFQSHGQAVQWRHQRCIVRFSSLTPSSVEKNALFQHHPTTVCSSFSSEEKIVQSTRLLFFLPSRRSLT